MAQSTRMLNTLIGALALSAGLASPLALADEEAPKQDPQAQEELEQDAEQVLASDERNEADYVKVRVSLPNGKTFTRLEPRHSMSARYTNSGSSRASTSRRLSDGSRISVGARSVSGGSNGSSVRAGSSGGGGGGSSSSSGGGGGGGGSAASSGAELSKDRSMTAEADASSKGGGIFSFGSDSSGSQGAGSGASSVQVDSRHSVPTLGEPTFDRSGHATGGQRVEFHDAGMSAAVIGNRVYFNNVELVTADQPFEIVTGTRLETNSVIMESGRLSSDGGGPLSSFNTRGSTVKLELESGTIVTFMMYTQSGNSLMPEREMRSWTVRIR